MADIDFDDFDQDDPVTRSAAPSRWINVFGATCSVALVLGLVVWGYKLAVRDVNGVPVVRALEGPLRIAPENPGGDFAVHQGLSVNAVAAVGAAAPLPETVKLAPEATALTAEDAAGLAVVAPVPLLVTPPVQSGSVTFGPPANEAGLRPVEIAAPAPLHLDPVALPQPEAAALISDGASDLAKAAALPETQADAVAAALAAALADGEVLTEVSSDPVAVAKSRRPMARPARAAAPAAVVTPAPLAEIAASAIPIGTRLVQLGAFDGEDIARGEWLRLQARFPELIGSKALVVQSAQSGGRTFFRLRAHGFADEDESRRFCAALLAENASCIAVTQR